MIYVVWSLPLIAIAALIASGRVTSVGAGSCGALVAIIVSLTAAPTSITALDILATAGKGLWLSWLVAAVIFAGLFFREIVSTEDDDRHLTGTYPTSVARRRVFAACFLIGPFAEAATGFGVGQVTTAGILHRTGMAPIHIVLLALFSQTLVSWGAMANGTIVGAEFAGLLPRDLGTHSAVLSAPLLLGWLFIFWHMAASAGLGGLDRNVLIELIWVLSATALLILGNYMLGPEIAAMAALGRLIVLQFWCDEKPDRSRWLSTLRVGLPYAALIAGLAGSRGVPALTNWLRDAAALRPFADCPAWFPLLHPSSWMLAVALVTAIVSGRASAVPRAVRMMWLRGKLAVLTISIYLIIARVLADSGIAAVLAQGLGHTLGPFAALATPWLAGAFGFLTGSSNATNGLLMASQANISANGSIPLPWIAAIQNTAAASLTMLSPARVAMGCALVGRKDLEREVYRGGWLWARHR